MVCTLKSRIQEGSVASHHRNPQFFGQSGSIHEQQILLKSLLTKLCLLTFIVYCTLEARVETLYGVNQLYLPSTLENKEEF